MAGHSKWKNIQHRKGAQDAKRGKAFTKLLKEVGVAVRTGGGPDVDSNARLRLAVTNCRGSNVPKDTIERAIKKATGAGGEDWFESTFEGYGPDGVAVFVEAMTDNNTRTVADVRSYFRKYNGSLGKDGSLEFVFNRKGIFVIEAEGLDEDDFTMEMLDASAEDVEFEEGFCTITTEMEDFGSVQAKLAELKIEPKEAGLQRIPITMKEMDAQNFPTFMKLIDALEDNDDVQNVYHNLVYDDSFMAE